MLTLMLLSKRDSPKANLPGTYIAWKMLQEPQDLKPQQNLQQKKIAPRLLMALVLRDYPSDGEWHRHDLEDVEELLGRDLGTEEFFEWE